MPKPFRQISVTQFQELVRNFDWQRKINEIHMHHTWQPNHSQYHGLASLDSMWDFHVNTNHWSDIAQHITIAPDGTIWTGRGWNTPPASSTGHNGSSARGPFMFELIGNFDNGRDQFDGLQKGAAIAVVAALLDQFDLSVSALRFHRQLGSPKTCPGTSIDYNGFCAEVEAHRSEKDRSRAPSRRTIPAAQKRIVTELKAILEETSRAWEDDSEADCCAEHGGGDRGLFGPTWSAKEKETLSRHVINLRAGQFTASGDYTTSEEDVRRLFNQHLPTALAKARAAGRKLRVLFWAHGGLVKEKGALKYALDHIEGWMGIDVYPIYFIWETSLLTTLKDLFKGEPGVAERGWISDRTDALWENALHQPGVSVWGKMKDYAAYASLPNGGGLFTARQLAAFATQAGTDAVFFACGHSAGSIFHAHFLPCVGQQGGPNFQELFLLAPAITVDDFKAQLAERIGADKGIERSTMFTMNRAAEMADNVGHIYRKSLLYFVSRACEPVQPTPILGLEESLRADPEMASLFGLAGHSSHGEIIWSPNGAGGGPNASKSTSHGFFDNDHVTLNSLACRITGNNTAAPFDQDRTLASLVATGGDGARKALCIGIDDYPSAQLAGCVNDALQWQSTFSVLGFDTKLLTNAQATRVAMLQALRQMVIESRPGDCLVFQYAGHGTHVDDVDGDENDGQDEALVPFDYESGSFLIDDDIGEIINELPDGVNLTCFMDCCHSGTNTRVFGFGRPNSVAGEKVRYLRVPPDLMAKHIALRKIIPAKAAKRTYLSTPEVLFAACSPQQTAKEINGHGYFTTVACPLLLESAGRVTHAEFLANLRQRFPLPSDNQAPELNCAENLRSQVILAASPRGTFATSVGGQPGLVQKSQPQRTIDAQMLVESMHDYMKVLKRLV